MHLSLFPGAHCLAPFRAWGTLRLCVIKCFPLIVKVPQGSVTKGGGLDGAASARRAVQHAADP